MRKLLINALMISSSAVTLSGCSGDGGIKMPDISLPDKNIPGIYKIEVRQGNLITQEMVNELKPGMTKKQVTFLLGTPLLLDSFHPDRWDYLYTIRPASDAENTEAEKKRLTLDFKNNRLVKITGDLYPQGEALAKATKEENRERTLVIPPDAPREDDGIGIFKSLWNTVGAEDDPARGAGKLPPQEDSGETAENTENTESTASGTTD